MALINLAYLTLGLGIGIGSSWLLGHSKGQNLSQETHQEASNLKEPAAPQETHQEVSQLKEPAAPQETHQDAPTLKEPAAPQETHQEVSHLKEPAAPQDPGFDVSTLKEQLKQTQLAYQMATEMSKFKAGFLARTSHELRSPLSSMIGLHQLILCDLCENPTEEREFVAQAHASALNLVKLIDEIVAVAKTEHGTTSLEIQPLHLAGVLEEVYNLTHLQAANRSFRLQVSPPDPEIYVKADPRRLRQVLVNLVDTAIVKMQQGSISIAAHPTPASGYVHIWIDAPCPESAWSEPVDLLKSERNPQAQPTKEGVAHTVQATQLSPGMNLLMNQTIMEAMGGRLEVVPSEDATGASQPSNFTRLQCTIPLESTESA